MYNRYPRVLTTVEEDFRKIGLLQETDDPAKPRDIPSPDPSTLSGLDDSEGDKKAHTPSAKQPKPKMGPAADDAEKSGYDPEEDGGSKGATKGGSGKYTPPAGGKEAGLKGESKAAYQNSKKGVGPKGKGKNKGQKPALAMGLKPVKKHAGMKAEGTFGKAANLIEEVNDLLRGVQIDEEIDGLMRGFRLVAEDAALLADRLTEISDRYHVEEMVAAMESLSQDAVEALDIIENDIEIGLVGNDEEENSAIAHSADAEEDVNDIDEEDDGEKKVKSDRDPDKEYDIPSPAFKEEVEGVFKVMVATLMDGLEAYDAALDEMGVGADEAPETDHIDAYEGGDEGGFDGDAYEAADDDADDAGDDAGDDDDADDRGDDDQDDNDADDKGDDGDNDGDDLMSKMRNLRTKKDAMKGGGEKQPPFRGAE